MSEKALIPDQGIPSLSNPLILPTCKGNKWIHARNLSCVQKYHFKFIPSFPRMLVSKILARITQHAKLGLQTKTISVCVLMDRDLKATIVMRVRSLIFFIKAETRCISNKLRKWLVIVTEHRRWKPRMAQVIQNTKGTYMWTTMLLLMVHLGTGFFTHFCFLPHSVSIFFNAVSYPPSTRTNCNFSVSFLTKRMSTELSTKFTQRSDVIPYLHKNIKQWKIKVD